ncbi:MAG: amino acid ABC transporter permease [Treponema sp.]|nr:amino acid ABC transporter permease [Treponema sp.]
MKRDTGIMSALFEEPGPRTRRKIARYTILSLLLLAAACALLVRQFYETGQLSSRYWDFFLRRTTWLFLGKGLLGTVRVALVAVCLTLAMGFLMMLSRVRGNRVWGMAGRLATDFTRGVPTLLFIYFFYFVTPQLGIMLSAFWKITLPVAISASGSVAEVLRGGVNAVHRGQREAALSLGLSENRTFFKIIFPQAFAYVIPSLISELVIILKDTTFAYIVSFNDLMQNASVLISNYDALLSVYLVVAVIYILINYLLNRLSVALAGMRR